VGRLVIGDAVRMAGAGVAGGLLLALAVAPFVQSLLFQTSARELSVLAAAGAVLIGVTVLAAVLPAWRAARVSPLVALRAD
jgi:ABC-type antimicrobial peptide transport system permease subunit